MYIIIPNYYCSIHGYTHHAPAAVAPVQSVANTSPSHINHYWPSLGPSPDPSPSYIDRAWRLAATWDTRNVYRRGWKVLPAAVLSRFRPLENKTVTTTPRQKWQTISVVRLIKLYTPNYYKDILRHDDADWLTWIRLRVARIGRKTQLLSYAKCTHARAHSP